MQLTSMPSSLPQALPPPAASTRLAASVPLRVGRCVTSPRGRRRVAASRASPSRPHIAERDLHAFLMFHHARLRPVFILKEELFFESCFLRTGCLCFVVLFVC